MSQSPLPAENNFCGGIWGQTDEVAQNIYAGIFQTLRHVAPQEGIFFSDNLLAWRRNLSFLHNRDFMAAVEKNSETLEEKGIIWRHYFLAWCAEQALRRKGDFVECGCYRGTSARIVCDYVNFGATDKTYWLYDLFEYPDDAAWHTMPAHGKKLHKAVRKRFDDLPNVKIVKGRIPESLENKAPRKIAFLHLDLNNAASEIAALEILFERVVTGGLIVLDDYGWLYYRDQKKAHDDFFAAHGLHVMELPTGQGLVLK